MRSKFFASAMGSLALVAMTLVFLAVPTTPVENANAYFQPTNIRASGLTGSKTLALTFDDGPSAFTPELLDVLAEHNIKATFFVVGTRARHHSATLARMAREGHVIANHSYSHAQLGRRYAANPELLVEQIAGTDAIISTHGGASQGYYFRAPYGVWRRVHAEVLNSDPVLRRYVGPVYWDIGGETSFNDDGDVRTSADWDCWSRDWTPEECGRGYMREISRKRGGIVLMHDIRERTVRMVRNVLPALVADGYRFVTLDDVPALDQFRTPSGEDVPVADAGTPASTVLMAR